MSTGWKFKASKMSTWKHQWRKSRVHI